MKYILPILLILASVRMSAQNPIFFDPAHDPVALRTDSTLQLLVSEYVLTKSVKARLGPDCKVLKAYKHRSPKGAESLIFEGIYLAKNGQHFTLSVPLVPDAQGRFYYTSSQSIVCSAPGCNNCSIDNGNCVGCCSDANGSAVALPTPLLKVQINIE